MDHDFRIRGARPDDRHIIVSFNQQLARETEERELDVSTLDRGVGALLRDPGKGRYWLAEDGSGEVVGQSMVTFEWSDWRDGQIWWLQSVYVREDSRRQGVFQALYRHIRNEALSEPEVCALRLYVEKRNDIATQTYESLGMHAAGYEVLEEALDDSQ